MIRPALLLLVAMTVCGCAVVKTPNPADPNWAYVSTHDCAPVRHDEPFIIVRGGEEHRYLGYTVYACKGVDDVHVEDPPALNSKEPK